MQRVAYSVLLRLALPLQALRFLARGLSNPANRGSLRAHLALGLAPRNDRPVWLHAASVGEVQALAPLARGMRAAFPDVPLLVTVGTATGMARARQQLGAGRKEAAISHDAVSLLAAPWDLPGAARRFIASQRPRLAVFVETELWPNLVQQASRTGIPLMLASARVSARSAGRYRRWAATMMRDTVRAFERIGAQSAVDRDRFIQLGAAPEAVECWGNLKFDFVPPPDTAARATALRAALAPDRPLWVAGSTHAGEEEACLAAQAALRRSARAAGRPEPVMVVAPRRPERFGQVAELVVARGFALGRMTRPSRQAIDVLLVDAMGELLPCYAAADVAFVGGSLVPVGGHNLLEPAALCKPVIAGPFTGNSPDVARRLEEAGALARVRDADMLAAALQELLEDAALARRRGEAAGAVVAANAGATTRTLAAISAVLARPAGPTACPPAPSAGG